MKYVLRILGAALLALLLGFVFAIMVGGDSGGQVFAFLFIAGLIVYSVLLIRLANRVGFWFCLTFAIEWALLPIAVAVHATQLKGEGCAGFGAAIGAGILLGVTIPIGALGFFIFLALALFRFRRGRREAGKLEGVGGGETGF